MTVTQEQWKGLTDETRQLSEHDADVERRCSDEGKIERDLERLQDELKRCQATGQSCIIRVGIKLDRGKYVSGKLNIEEDL